MALLPMHMLGLGLFGQQGGMVGSPANLQLQDPEGTWQFQGEPWDDMFGLGSMQDDMLGEDTYSEPSYTPVMPGEVGMGPSGHVGFRIPGMPQSSSQPGDVTGAANVSRGTFDANPWQLALLAAGSELLKSSNWSRYPQSLGAGLGAAGQAGIGTYMGAKRQQDQSALAKEQMEAMRGTRAAQAEYQRALAEDTKRKTEKADVVRAAYENYVSAVKVLNDPANANNLSVINTATAQRDAALNRVLLLTNPKELLPGTGQKPSALNERIQTLRTQLISEGMPEVDAQKAAVGVATGRYRIVADPMNQRSEIFDMATHKPIWSSQAPTPQPAAQTMIPEGVQADEATGLSGKLKNWANTITDAIGAGLAFPKAREAQVALNNLKQQTIGVAQVAVPGRPSNFAMQLIERGMTIEPNSILMGEDTAKLKLEQTTRWLQTEMDRMKRDILEKSENYRPQQVAETRVNYSQMQQLLTEYQRLMEGFGKKKDRKPLEEIF